MNFCGIAASDLLLATNAGSFYPKPGRSTARLGSRGVNDEGLAAIALGLWIWHFREGFCPMVAVLGRVDAIMFTAGIEEHQVIVCYGACANLGWFDVALDPLADRLAVPDEIGSAALSRVSVLVIRTCEEMMLARETRR